jgi:hypothetical protein
VLKRFLMVVLNQYLVMNVAKSVNSFDRDRPTNQPNITDQKNHKKKFESVASQRFQIFSWFGFERKAL